MSRSGFDRETLACSSLIDQSNPKDLETVDRETDDDHIVLNVVDFLTILDI